FGIGQQGYAERPAMVGLDLLREAPALLRLVAADRKDSSVGKHAGEIAKSDQLPDAVRSPEAAIEDEHDLVAVRSGEADDVIVLIEKTKVRCDVANARRRGGRADEEECREKEPAFHGGEVCRIA